MLAFGQETPMLRDFLYLILFFVLLVTWAMAWLVFHVAGGLIHLLLIIAVFSLILHLFRGRSAA
jgi:F0F1-type ATP synthase assembly protein I